MANRSQQKQGQTGAWISAVVNIILTLGKGSIGVWSGSRALTADAIHSAADVVGSVAVIIGLRIARKPPDAEHPYGHGRAELISSAVVALFLIAAGFDVGYSSIRSLFKTPAEPSLIAAYTAAAAILMKEAMFQYNYRLGKRLNSRSLIASAYDHRSDVFSSVAALIGIALSLWGRHIHVHFLLYMDSVAGAFVALLVLKMGYKIAYDSMQTLMDKVVEEANVGPYRDFILDIYGVREIHELRVRDHGQYVIIDVKVAVDAFISVAEGHDIASEVKRALMAAFPRIQDVLVHVNPYYDAHIAGGIRND